MSESVWKRCLDKVVAQLQPLATEHVLRELAVRVTAAHEAAAKPALHVIPGNEVADEEDTCGYTCTRDLLLKITFSSVREPFTKAAELVAAVQAALETDETLGGLAIHCIYRGEQPFISEAAQPAEGTFLQYEVKYHRKVGRPDLKY